MSQFRVAVAGICLFAIQCTAMAVDGGDPFLPNAPPRGAPTAAATEVADKVRPTLPKGWTVTPDGDRVIVERSDRVLFHNDVNAARGQPRRNIPIVYQITLTLGEHLTDQQFHDRVTANTRAVAEARKDLGKSKTDAERYAGAHPKYGYHPLPWLDAGRNSLYVERTLGGFARFTSKDVEAECNKASDAIADLFHRYEAKCVSFAGAPP
jgi:hypothetical protein